MSSLDAALKRPALAQTREPHLARNLHSTLLCKYLSVKHLSSSCCIYPNATVSFPAYFNSFPKENNEKLSHIQWLK